MHLLIFIIVIKFNYNFFIIHKILKFSDLYNELIKIKYN